MNEIFKGIFPALVTPFEDGKFSSNEFKNNIEKYNKAGLSGYLVLGSTGESVLISLKERLAAVETVVSNAAEGRKVIVGTGMQSLDDTVEFTNQIAELKPHAALIVTPFYYKGQMDKTALKNYFLKTADKVKLPVLIYNVPKYTGVDIPSSLVAELAEHENIIGIKDSSGNLAKMTELVKFCPDSFSILQGSGSVLYPSLVTGASGGILALASMAPKECAMLYDAFKSGDLDTAKALQLRLLKVNQKIVGGYAVPGVKYAVSRLGYFGGLPKEPLLEVKDEVKAEIDNLLYEAELI